MHSTPYVTNLRISAFICGLIEIFLRILVFSVPLCGYFGLNRLKSGLFFNLFGFFCESINSFQIFRDFIKETGKDFSCHIYPVEVIFDYKVKDNKCGVLYSESKYCLIFKEVRAYEIQEQKYKNGGCPFYIPIRCLSRVSIAAR